MTVAYVPEEIRLATPQLSSGFAAYRTRLDPERYWQAADNEAPMYSYRLHGPAGVVDFVAGRHKLAPGPCEWCSRYPSIHAFDADGNCWQPWEVGRHSPRAIYPDERPANRGEECEVLGGRRCFYDGSPLQGLNLAQRWLAAGGTDEALVAELREYYSSWLGER